MAKSKEHMQFINETLQLIAGELETAQKELKTVTEKLETIDRELEKKYDALQQANSDLEKMMRGNEGAIIFVDRGFRLQGFTDNASRLFGFSPSDQESPFNYDSVIENIAGRHSIEEHAQKIVTDKNGNFYVMHLRPYITSNKKIEGMVITIIDVTQIKAAQTSVGDKNERIKELQQQIMKVKDHERWKIGQYLHDELAQKLVVAKYTLFHLREKVNRKEPSVTNELNKLSELIQQGITEVRNLSHDIMPYDVRQKDIGQAFAHLAKDLKKIFDLHCEVEGYDVVKKIENPEIVTNLYRIVRECGRNAAMHGNAKNMIAVFHSDDSYLYLDIEDDGKGLPETGEKDGGMGINIMRHQMEFMGGTFKVNKSTKFNKTGVHIACRIPWNEMEK